MTELFDGLFDDASSFPPGNAPLPEAVRLHREHRQAWYASLVGPLLVPAAGSRELLEIVADDPEPLRVALIMRPGHDVQDLLRAVSDLDGHPTVTVAGVEMGWHPGWQELDLHHLPMVLEVGRDEGQYVALNDIRRARRDGVSVIAKYRTGPTRRWAWPDEAELAEFLVNATERSLPFKLTGGLHHLVRGSYGHGDSAEQENHGLLNIIVAVAAALGAATQGAVASMLADRRGPQLVDRVEKLSQDQIRSVRGVFTSYGCCTVTDPIGELKTLGLL